MHDPTAWGELPFDLGTVTMLGICVVYLVTEADGYALLDHSVHQIKRLTRGPFRIYGCCPNGDDETIRRMTRNGIIHQDIPERRPHISEEHSNLLDMLVDRAIRDDCTHVVTFDMDSWPICDGWDELYCGILDDRFPLAAMMRTELYDNFPFAAFICMRRDFWEVGSSSFSTQLRARFKPDAAGLSRRPRETGSGILAQLFRDSQSFLRLERSNRWNVHPLIAGLYDNTIFHLGAGSREPRFVCDDWSYGLNGSELRRAFADRMNAEVRAFAIEQILQRHDQFLNQLAGGNRGPLTPIQCDPAELPREMALTPIECRRLWGT